MHLVVKPDAGVPDPVSDGLVALVRRSRAVRLRRQPDVSVAAAHQDEPATTLRDAVPHQAYRAEVHPLLASIQTLEEAVERRATAFVVLETGHVLDEYEVGSTRFNEVAKTKQERDPLVLVRVGARGVLLGERLARRTAAEEYWTRPSHLGHMLF